MSRGRKTQEQKSRQGVFFTVFILILVLLCVAIFMGMDRGLFAAARNNEKDPVSTSTDAGDASNVGNAGDIGDLTVHFIDVGQADAVLIDKGEFEVLVDGGNNKDGNTVVSYLKDYVDGKLDLMIATHPDADHIGGLDTVLDAYDVAEIIDSGHKKTTKTYKEYWATAESEPDCQVLFDEDRVIDLGGGAILNVIETGDGYKHSNDNSIVAQLNYGEVSLLLTGDMEKAAEAAALSRFGKVTVLKAGHHGSATSSSQAFLDLTKPEYVIVSAGKDNSYGHPHQAVLERYFQGNATVYGTFRSGTIVMTTDGNSLSFNTNDPVVLSDAGDYENAA